MKKNVRMILSVLLLCWLITSLIPTTVNATSCEFKNDECTKCGNLRLHPFKKAILFYTAKENVPIWSRPTKHSDKIQEVESKGTELELEAILRNKYGNVWFKVSGEEAYVYLENIYLDFYVLSMLNLQQIIAWDESEIQLSVFYDLVKSGGIADYKVSLDPGGKGIRYSVKIDDKFYSMTAEDLGNIHYGFLGRIMGFSPNVLLYAGGAVNVKGKLEPQDVFEAIEDSNNTCKVFSIIPDFYSTCMKMSLSAKAGQLVKEIYSECSKSYCDTLEDANNVQKGIDLFDLGEFDW